MNLWMLFSLLSILLFTSAEEECGGILHESSGVIQTPNFPNKFKVPIRCRWILNAPNDDTSTVIYFTQLFVTRGLTFTEFELESNEGRVIHKVTEKNVTFVQWLLTKKDLVIDFELNELESNHLRIMDNLLDVYGFNLTYEKTTMARPTACSAVACSFSGHCYASKDFQEYTCSCFPGFSGKDCGHGPYCDTKQFTCYNGGICRHVGSKHALCSCPEDYIGPTCETSLIAKPVACVDEGKCTEECIENDLPEPCSCEAVETLPDLQNYARYEARIQLKLSSLCSNNTSHCDWKWQLEHQLTDYMWSKNISILEFKISRIKMISRIEIIIILLGEKREKNNIREYMYKFLDEFSFEDITLNKSFLKLIYEPALYIKSVQINQPGYILDEGSEFVLSCLAQGSPHMVFRWFKDGIFVNVSQAERNIWTSLLPLDSSDHYTALLGIEHAEALDQGRYTCHVTDYGYQQCRTVVIEVIRKSQLRVFPMSLTVFKDSNFSIQCMSPDDLPYSYSWTKSDVPIKIYSGQEYAERLLPIGSMLTVNNIQNTTLYGCHFGPFSQKVLVEVVDRTGIPWCPEDNNIGISWDKAVPGIISIKECPIGYTGNVTRMCESGARWLIPDFSGCLSESLAFEVKQFRKLKFGYGNTTIVEVLTNVVKSLNKQESLLYPGEGETYLEFLKEVTTYMEMQKAWADLPNIVILFYRAVDILLQKPYAIINPLKIEDLNELINRYAMLWQHQDIERKLHLSFDVIVVDLFKYQTMYVHEGFMENFPKSNLGYPLWYNPHLSLHLTLRDLNKTNHSISLGIISIKSYSNLHLKRSYHDQNKSGSYEMVSGIINLVVNGDVNIASQADFRLSSATSLNSLKCGINKNSTWDLTLCRTKTVDKNITRCLCPVPGSYALFNVKNNVQVNETTGNPFSYVLILGCVCFLIQSLFTVIFLIIHLLHLPRSYFLFLKVQFCTAVSLIMIIFLYKFNSAIDVISSYISATLKIFYLIAMTSQLSKLLMINIEVNSIPKYKHVKPSILGSMTAAVVLSVLLSYLTQSVQAIDLKWQWFGVQRVFYIFIFVVILINIAFIALYLKTFGRLRLLTRSTCVESRKVFKKKLDLMKRPVLLFFDITLLIFFTVLLQYWPNLLFQYLFSILCALSGGLLIFCYIACSESTLNVQGLHDLRLDNIDLGYSSNSDKSPSISRREKETSFVKRHLENGLVPSSKLQRNHSLGAIVSRSKTDILAEIEVNGLINSGDSNDSGVQFEVGESQVLEVRRCVSYHTGLSTGSRIYPNKLNEIKKMESQLQMLPAKRTFLQYQPRKNAVEVLIDSPTSDVCIEDRILKTETRVVH